MKTALLRRNSYTWAGLGLLVGGIVPLSASYFIFHVSWLSALDICMFIMAAILLALRKVIPEIPPELLLETGVENMATPI